MNNKYDVVLTNDEAKELANSVSKITDFAKDLVAYYGTSATLVAQWTYFDRVWGNRTCNIEVERTYRFKGIWGDSEKEWYGVVKGHCGKLYFDFDELTTEELLSSCHSREYALSLIDNWKEIKQELLAQDKQREETRQLVKGFEL